MSSSRSQPCGDGTQPILPPAAEPSAAASPLIMSQREDFEDDFDEPDFEDDEDGFECGAFINGRFDYAACQLAGTEDCDWECPYSAGERGLRA